METFISRITTFPNKGRIFLSLFIFPTLLLLQTGCALFQSDPLERSFRVEYEKVYTSVFKVLGNHYSIGEADRTRGLIKTRWKINPDPTETKRMQVVARIHPAGTGFKEYRVSLKAIRQTVEDWTKSYKPKENDWDSDGRDQEIEKTLMDLISIKIKSDERMESILEQAERNKKLEERLDEINKEMEEED